VITGAHFVLYSKDAEADRVFLRDVLGFRAVDIGHGWLIFSMPPTEAAVHPASGESAKDSGEHPLLRSELYLMCEDLAETMETLKAKKVRFAAVTRERWGHLTSIRLPSGGSIGLYQPTHATALETR
jgi:Glyoxalase/Bleomycin resistance protein/Dioxygenase superfamily